MSVPRLSGENKNADVRSNSCTLLYWIYKDCRVFFFSSVWRHVSPEERYSQILKWCSFPSRITVVLWFVHGVVAWGNSQKTELGYNMKRKVLIYSEDWDYYSSVKGWIYITLWGEKNALNKDALDQRERRGGGKRRRKRKKYRPSLHRRREGSINHPCSPSGAHFFPLKVWWLMVTRKPRLGGQFSTLKNTGEGKGRCGNAFRSTWWLFKASDFVCFFLQEHQV